MSWPSGTRPTSIPFSFSRLSALDLYIRRVGYRIVNITPLGMLRLHVHVPSDQRDEFYSSCVRYPLHDRGSELIAAHTDTDRDGDMATMSTFGLGVLGLTVFNYHEAFFLVGFSKWFLCMVPIGQNRINYSLFCMLHRTLGMDGLCCSSFSFTSTSIYPRVDRSSIYFTLSLSGILTVIRFALRLCNPTTHHANIHPKPGYTILVYPTRYGVQNSDDHPG